MANTPITDRIIKENTFFGSTDLDGLPVAVEMRKLELAANKLYSQLSIWVNTTSISAAGYTNMKDLEALAEFELLRKP
jgi:hypothetical protein